jgi:putative glutamine amidotransferase
MRPVIGVTSNLQDQLLSLSMSNIDALTESGAVPMVLPNLLDEDSVDVLVKKLDGLLVTGGGDIDPTLFGEEPHQKLGGITPERDTFEINIIKKMLELNKPILAICRGCQIVCIAAGGDMYQDIYTQIEGNVIQHSQRAPKWHGSHYIEIETGSMLHQITKSTKFKVNSFHHQAVRSMPDQFEVCATSSDGVIEAFESKQHSFVLAVQWHPECMIEKGDQPSLAIFQSFVQAARTKE